MTRAKIQETPLPTAIIMSQDASTQEDEDVAEIRERVRELINQERELFDALDR